MCLILRDHDIHIYLESGGPQEEFILHSLFACINHAKPQFVSYKFAYIPYLTLIICELKHKKKLVSSEQKPSKLKNNSPCG